MTNSWSRALGLDPVDTVLDIRTVDNKVTEANLRIPGRFYDPTVAGFQAWRDQRYPEAAEIMEDVNGYAIFTDESIELWRQYTEEFVAEHLADEAGLLQTAESVAQAIAAGDSTTLLDLLSDDAVVVLWHSRVGRITDGPTLRAIWAVTGLQISPGECRLYPPSASGSAQLAQCEMNGVSDAWDRALGIDPFDTVADIRVEDGEVTYAVLRLPAGLYDQGYEQFKVWLDQRHPEAAEIMLDPSGTGIFTDESIELWRQHTEEFVAEHSAG